MDGTKTRSKYDAGKWNAVTPTLPHPTSKAGGDPDRKGREGWGTQCLEVMDEKTNERVGHPPGVT